MVSQGDKNQLHHEANRKLVSDAAERKGLTVKQLFEAASEAVGLSTYYDYMSSGNIPLWFEAWCMEIMLNAPRRAKNMLQVPLFQDVSGQSVNLDSDMS